MYILKNILLTGKHHKPIPADIFYLKTSKSKPVVIYAHGFNGFKDWGNFDMIASKFASAGFVFIKFNFSHNGTTPAQPEMFADLEAYAENNYTKELDDLGCVIDWTVCGTNPNAQQIDAKRVYLLGHSRGGGIVLLKAAEDSRIKAVATWASVSECKTPWGSWTEEKMQEWKDNGVQYIANSRTKQQMPLHYQLYEDYNNHKIRLNIKEAVSGLQIPSLICHGLNDDAVPVEKAYELGKWNKGSEVFLVESDHVFGRKHPWVDPVLPTPMEAVIDKTINFFMLRVDI
jgi:predicted dienelactone hydrolase